MNFLQKIIAILTLNWKSILRLTIIVVFSTILGWLFKDRAFGKFFSGANENTYMSYYYNYYTAIYEKENRGENEGESWASKLFTIDGKYEASLQDVVLIHLGNTWKCKIPEVLFEIMKYNPSVIGLDIIYNDSTKVDSLNKCIKDICGNKLVIAAEKKNNKLITSGFYLADSSVSVLGSVRTQSIGRFRKDEIIAGDTVFAFPYLLAKMHCDYHGLDLQCDDRVINYRRYTLSPIDLENASEEKMKTKIELQNVTGKVVILGIVDIDTDKVIIPCDLPSWSPNNKMIMQSKDVLGTAMSGIFNHAYVVRSLIHPGVSFKMKYNIIINIGFIFFYVFLFLRLKKKEEESKKNICKYIIRLLGQLLFIIFLLITLRVPFLITNHFNYVFDFTLALFSIIFIPIVDTLYSLVLVLIQKH